ncbi:protein of unknown function [Pseudorhizobium banfieldiae]|uniref:Uncharacterized protein n=1 Tax=Pseudorhizobium banfieldiae TaxID=1125847 RepID=L0NCF3_9HYPH|nr:protein of unknown function [Pseudorhizobium banfieldiae]
MARKDTSANPSRAKYTAAQAKSRAAERAHMAGRLPPRANGATNTVVATTPAVQLLRRYLVWELLLACILRSPLKPKGRLIEPKH